MAETARCKLMALRDELARLVDATYPSTAAGAGTTQVSTGPPPPPPAYIPPPHSHASCLTSSSPNQVSQAYF